MDTYGCAKNVMESRHHHRHQHQRRQDAKLPDYVQTVVVKDSKGLEKILLLPKALDLDRPKRSRTAFAKWQLDALETTFCSHPYLVGEQRTLLARRLGLSETQIKVWYQNRRTKQRKEGHPAGSEDQPPQQIRGEMLLSDDQLRHQSSSVLAPTESSGSPPEMKWPQQLQQQQQQHQAMSADFFGQAFQHYHPAIYHQLIQSYSSHHHAIASGAGSVANAAGGGHSNSANSAASAGVSSTDRSHHQIHRVY